MADHRATIDALRDLLSAQQGEPWRATIVDSVDRGKQALHEATNPSEVIAALQAVDDDAWEALFCAASAPSLADARRRHARWFEQRLAVGERDENAAERY